MLLDWSQILMIGPPQVGVPTLWVKVYVILQADWDMISGSQIWSIEVKVCFADSQVFQKASWDALVTTSDAAFVVR